MKILTAFLLILATTTHAQELKPKTFKNANRIAVRTALPADSNYRMVLNSIIDNGYSIDNKDAELKTVRTQPKSMKYGTTYFYNIVARDSLIYISGVFNMNTNINAGMFTATSSDTQIADKGIPGSEFRKTYAAMENFAKLLGGEILYQKL